MTTVCNVNDVSSGLVYYYPFDEEFSRGDVYKDQTLYTKNVITGKEASLNDCYIDSSDYAVGDGSVYLPTNSSSLVIEPINIPIYSSYSDNILSGKLIEGITISIFMKSKNGIDISFSGLNIDDPYSFEIDLSNNIIITKYGKVNKYKAEGYYDSSNLLNYSVKS